MIEHAGTRRARRRPRDARPAALRRGGGQAHPALQVVRGRVPARLRHALRRHRTGQGDRRRHPQPLAAGRLPRHPAHRVDHPEALRREREGQRGGAARSAVRQPAAAPLARGEPARQARHARSSTRSPARSTRRRSRSGIDDYMDIGKILDGGPGRPGASSTSRACRRRSGARSPPRTRPRSGSAAPGLPPDLPARPA